MSREPYFVGDWESACAMLQCDRDECRIEKGGIKDHIFQEVLPFNASLDDVTYAWSQHVAQHEEQDHIPEEDLEFEYYHFVGQPVNQGPRGVKLIHVPTGMVFRASDGRSQLENEALVIAKLREWLKEEARSEQ